MTLIECSACVRKGILRLKERIAKALLYGVLRKQNIAIVQNKLSQLCDETVN